MHKNRLEAFTDGVIAIILTIMVLELKVPHGVNLSDLSNMASVFLCYVLSFIFIGIYWNNHHHMFQAVTKVNGAILWANLHLLFWLSLIPFATAWMGENGFSPLPVSVYGLVLIACALAYYILVRNLISHHGLSSSFAKAIGSDKKEKISLAIYITGVCLSFVSSWFGYIAYITVAIIWLVPDRRFEKSLEQKT